MKHFSDGNMDIPYENNHFDDTEREYFNYMNDGESMIKHFSDDNQNDEYEPTIKHFQD